MGFESSSSSWTRYWLAGNQDSCFTAAGTFSLEAHWLDFFRSLPPGARVLDLATGNGAVALMAATVSREQDLGFHITAVDQARIDPRTALKDPPPDLDRIEFLPATPLETLPFPDASFDAICSQFGFEYAETGPSLQQVTRVSAPGAGLHLVMHARNGEVEKSSRTRLARVNGLLAADGVMALAREIAALQVSASLSSHMRIRKLEARLLSKMKKALKKLEGVSRDDTALGAVNYLGSLMNDRSRIDPAEFEHFITDLDRELRAYVVRLNTMISAGKSASEVEAIVAGLEQAGFAECHSEALEDRAGIVAWRLTAHK